jgi:hypothetical protein
MSLLGRRKLAIRRRLVIAEDTRTALVKNLSRRNGY